LTLRERSVCKLPGCARGDLRFAGGAAHVVQRLRFIVDGLLAIRIADGAPAATAPSGILYHKRNLYVYIYIYIYMYVCMYSIMYGTLVTLLVTAGDALSATAPTG